jgi:hypothetical protein
MVFHALHVLLAVQAAQAAVAGTVRDEATGEPLPGAVVVLPDLNRGTTSDVKGHYLLLDVPPGPQHISVRFIGYTPRPTRAGATRRPARHRPATEGRVELVGGDTQRGA